MKRTIKFASFHQSVFIPGLGELGKVLPSPAKRIADLRMFTDGITLEVSANHHVMLIPLTNVVVMHVDDTDNKEAIPAVLVNQPVNKKAAHA